MEIAIISLAKMHSIKRNYWWAEAKWHKEENFLENMLTTRGDVHII